MTKEQLFLNKWIKKNFEEIKIEYPSKTEAEIIDCNGGKMKITIDENFDIFECETNKKLARCSKVENQIPMDWIELPY